MRSIIKRDLYLKFKTCNGIKSVRLSIFKYDFKKDCPTVLFKNLNTVDIRDQSCEKLGLRHTMTSACSLNVPELKFSDLLHRPNNSDKNESAKIS